MLFLAAVFHDIIYNPQSNTNEEDSAMHDVVGPGGLAGTLRRARASAGAAQSEGKGRRAERAQSA